MFSSFFRSRQWALWAWLGMVVIVGGTYYQVQVDVMINEWFGQFYDMVQKALTTPNAKRKPSFSGLCSAFSRSLAFMLLLQRC